MTLLATLHADGTWIPVVGMRSTVTGELRRELTPDEQRAIVASWRRFGAKDARHFVILGGSAMEALP